MVPADFKKFFLDLAEEDKDRFAQAAGSTVSNIRSHWVYARRLPRNKLAMERLYQACTQFGAGFSRDELISFFYQQEAVAPIEAPEIESTGAHEPP